MMSGLKGLMTASSQLTSALFQMPFYNFELQTFSIIKLRTPDNNATEEIFPSTQ